MTFPDSHGYKERHFQRCWEDRAFDKLGYQWRTMIWSTLCPLFRLRIFVTVQGTRLDNVKNTYMYSNSRCFAQIYISEEFSSVLCNAVAILKG